MRAPARLMPGTCPSPGVVPGTGRAGTGQDECCLRLRLFLVARRRSLAEHVSGTRPARGRDRRGPRRARVVKSRGASVFRSRLRRPVPGSCCPVPGERS